MIRVLCARVDDPYTHYHGKVHCRDCSQCGAPVLVEQNTLNALASRDYALWCLECNHADPKPKLTFAFRETP